MIKLRLLILGLIFALSVSAVQAQWYDPKNGEPPPGQHLHFNREVWEVSSTEMPEVAGDIVLDCFSDLKDELMIRLKRLPPEKTFSVWLTRKQGDVVERAKVMKAWEGTNATKFTFKSEDNGNGFFRGCLTACPLGKWKFVEVRYHTDGNGDDLQTSVVLFRKKLLAD
jgi:hypothetical protein